MEVFVDGAPVDLRYTSTRGRGALDNLVGVSSVAGIEVYTRSSTVPARFQRLNGLCGIVAIWTK